MIRSITDILINVPITLIALTFHEFAHGWVSGKLGDPTPKREGRMTLNPMAHLDPYGTILMILTGFGWAKPVMVNPMYYKDKKKGMALVGIAGPIMNILLAFIGLLIFAVVTIAATKIGTNANSRTLFSYVNSMSSFSYIMKLFVVRNLCFAVFNLIPIPPLDGSRVVNMFLPDSAYYKLMQLERYSMIIIIVLSLTGMFDTLIGTGVNALYGGMIRIISRMLKFIM